MIFSSKIFNMYSRQRIMKNVKNFYLTSLDKMLVYILRKKCHTFLYFCNTTKMFHILLWVLTESWLNERDHYLQYCTKINHNIWNLWFVFHWVIIGTIYPMPLVQNVSYAQSIYLFYFIDEKTEVQVRLHTFPRSFS